MFDATVTVMLELPEPGAEMVAGLKLTVTPEGMPDAESAIELLKPFSAVVVIVEDPWLPSATDNDEGDAEILKVGDPVTVSVTVVLCCTPPPLPVTVRG